MKTYGRKLNNACKCEFCFNGTFEKDSKTRERNLAKEEIEKEIDLLADICGCPPEYCDAIPPHKKDEE